MRFVQCLEKGIPELSEEEHTCFASDFQCVERVELKIQEMVPLFTDIGTNLEEAQQLCEQHDEVLKKLQNKHNPVEELLKQADETIARQKPKKEVSSCSRLKPT